ncbi:hypothetical protein ABN764_24280 [Paenibacillaceae sp. P-4]
MYTIEGWVKKWQNGESFDERKGNGPNPLKGRTRTSFGSVEEERDYLKVQVDYFKKRYPNPVKEKPSVSKRWKITFIIITTTAFKPN